MACGALGELFLLRDRGLFIWLIASLLGFVAVLVHELGHALAVRLMRGRMETIMVFPFQYWVRARRFGMAVPLGRGDTGGYVIYSLDRHQTEGGRAFVAAAGPVANFALALAALAATPWIPSWIHALNGPPPVVHQLSGMLPSDAESLMWSRWYYSSWSPRTGILLAHALALLSAGMGIANLLPFKGSDGEVIRRQ